MTTAPIPCAVCGKPFAPNELRGLDHQTRGTRTAILADHPALAPDALVCLPDLARFRRQHVERLLEAERGSLTNLDQEVLDSLQKGLPVVQDTEQEATEDRTFGQRSADALASFGGSWTFIIGFSVVLVLWMVLNITGLLFSTFDPYPFILLNLVLSSLAALQAPVIMMSQRRTEAKDRLRAENDYRVNLKAELEIRHLHDKIDLHLTRQWERLAAIQRLQIELLEDQSRNPADP